MRTPLKIAGVVLGAIILSTLGIAASDSVRGISNSLMGLAIEGEGGTTQCPPYMMPISVRGETLCVDAFEASPASTCPNQDPKNVMESEANIAAGTCAASSRPEAQPWVYVSLTQAQQACAKAGKRLPTNEEWYRAALGTPTGGECLVNDRTRKSARATGENACVSSGNMYDMIGNVWEWVDESVTNGQYAERALPETGYVLGVDADGVALTSAQDTPEALYGEDYFWSTVEGVKGMIRGGFYGGGSDAGLYAVNASMDLTQGSGGIGFRCVQDARF